LSHYRRHYVPGGSWFFTVNLRNRYSDLLVRYIDALRLATAQVKRRKPFLINGWVVLPEHMHCIWTLPEGDSDYSGLWRDIKKLFTRTLQTPGIWQPRIWEHMDYIYINPVKHGWVKRVQDWPYSTFHRDVQNGLYPLEWAGDYTDFTAGERR